MTTEDDFLHQLLVEPCDFQTRLVFADWLQERDDPRADAYCVIAHLKKLPEHFLPTQSYSGREVWCWWRPTVKSFLETPSVITDDWFNALRGFLDHFRYAESHYNFRDYRNPLDAERALVDAFLRLPLARRAELLTLSLR